MNNAGDIRNFVFRQSFTKITENEFNFLLFQYSCFAVYELFRLGEITNLVHPVILSDMIL